MTVLVARNSNFLHIRALKRTNFRDIQKTWVLARYRSILIRLP